MIEEYRLLVICSAAATFILTVLLSRIIIPVLKSKKMGQRILDIGPRWHKSKEGTPTMGGIAFIFASTITVTAVMILLVLMGNEVPLGLTTTFLYALSCAFIGCIDDVAKLRKKQNEGLTALQKIILQFITAAAYTASLVLLDVISDTLYIPFIDREINGLGIVYYIFLVVLEVGIVNSVNLADGIDGLASSEVLIVSLLFVASAFFHYSDIDEICVEVGLLGAIMAGSALGFLVYNFHPARVFMGDTGSLFFGALVIGGAVMTENALLVIVYGFMFILEALSDIIQVLYFKLTHGKRFFKMAPIHHHFEQCGWSEVKIVVVFSMATAIFSIAAYFGLRG